MPCDGCDDCQCGERLTQKLELPEHVKRLLDVEQPGTTP